MGPGLRRDDASANLMPTSSDALKNFTGSLVLAGAGKMGGAMLSGWLDGGLDPKRVTIIEPYPSDDTRGFVARGVQLNPDLKSIGTADVLVMAVKPQMFRDAGLSATYAGSLSGLIAAFGDEYIRYKKEINAITDEPIINTITGAEPIGPVNYLDIVAVIPATGNTIAKLANGIVDTPALMAIKAQLRNQKPVVIGISTNDALSLNAKNIGLLLNMKNIYFIPFRQDNPQVKANSILFDMEKTVDTICLALQGKQIQPVLLGPA